VPADRTGYGQYCPIARAVDVLGERWSLLVVRDMLVGATRFNELARGLPGMSRTLLTKRLRQLERVGIVVHADGEYHLTDAGEDLRPIVFGLGEWGAKWTFGDPEPSELDAELLVWWMHGQVDASVLPEGRTILHVRLTDDPRRFWLMVEHGEVSVCLVDPGFEVDLTITSDLRSLYLLWLGRLPFTAALRGGRVTLDGPTALVRLMPKVLLLSPVAPLVAAATRPG
jgi:DNA-binding HxlR family transcriptional regulator